VEVGTDSELMKLGGEYFRLKTLQGVARRLQLSVFRPDSVPKQNQTAQGSASAAQASAAASRAPEGAAL